MTGRNDCRPVFPIRNRTRREYRRINLSTLYWPLIAGVLAASAAVAEDTPLRYDITAGDRLIYERRVRTSSTEGAEPIDAYSEQVQIWGFESAGGETLMLLDQMRVEGNQGGETFAGLIRVNRRGQRQVPDETLARVQEIDSVFDLLPCLPPAYETQDTWETPPDHFGRVWCCTRVGRSPEHAGAVQVDFTEEDPTGVSKALGIARHGSFWFDPVAGHVVRLETEETDSLNGRRVESVTRLHERREVESGWRERRLLEMEQYRRTLRLSARMAEEISATPERAGEIISRAGRIWQELAAGIPNKTHSPFARIARSEHRRSVERLEHWRKRAETSLRWMGATAAQWSLQTPEGETLRSEKIRDRIVIEFFWRSDSPESLRSFEMLRRLQSELPPEGRRIVCLNMDGDVFAGRRAIDACGGGLTHVLAGPPIGAQAPAEVPIFRVLNRDAQVIAVYFGWQPFLARKLADLRP